MLEERVSQLEAKAHGTPPDRLPLREITDRAGLAGLALSRPESFRCAIETIVTNSRNGLRQRLASSRYPLRGRYYARR
jgi:hypothetical protein